MYLEWSDSEARFREYGDFPNNSTHIRVEMNEAVANGAVEASLVPFGVLGPRSHAIKFCPTDAAATAGGNSAGSVALTDESTRGTDAGGIVGVAQTTHTSLERTVFHRLYTKPLVTYLEQTQLLAHFASQAFSWFLLLSTLVFPTRPMLTSVSTLKKPHKLSP